MEESDQFILSSLLNYEFIKDPMELSQISSNVLKDILIEALKKLSIDIENK